MAKKRYLFLLPLIPLPPLPLYTPTIHHSLKQKTSTANQPQTAKSRTIAVRLVSMALTGYYKTLMRPRIHRPLSMLKYDPVVRKKVLFLEQKRGGK
ncbi:39S ribosomal protein L33, mitochondrial [Lachnellula cervina]|uniref:Large ribosomal subunit protein bL33m n=1 Tax=Lachnellula cervina TaxID=1316786 RepID=A0A7D8UT78_9HELO|nr:39S ribosomal protein L33, mitochondrial [Lachnellula cervina]